MVDGVVLDSIRKKKEIKLPKSGAIVWLWSDILAGEVMGGLQFDNLGQLEKTDSFKMLVSIIDDWNFIDKDGEKMPVTIDNLKKLSMSDFTVLVDHLSTVSKDESIPVEEKKS